MLALDLDEIPALAVKTRHFSYSPWSVLRFRRRDYLDGENGSLKYAALQKLASLGGEPAGIDKILLVCQVRCFGLYFSPINLFFCYRNGQACYLLAEVNNTPWRERHHYLVDLTNPKTTDKRFHVSPFMPLTQRYRWAIEPPALGNNAASLRVHIENLEEQKVFDATLAMTAQPFSPSVLKTLLIQFPIMTVSILRGIYWQAVKLFIKRIPIYSHPRGGIDGYHDQH